MEHELIKTADGSNTLYVKGLDEHYHSIFGAIQESMHVFINAGLHFIASEKTGTIKILEVGFGTGLNALLTAGEAAKLNRKINYTSLEAFPLKMELITKLNYVDCMKDEKLTSVFNTIHTCHWEQDVAVTENFMLKKINNTLQQIVFDETYELIYFDAFGPRVQPEMWTDELFGKIYASTEKNGCLVTYCAKGEVKRALKRVGFAVETLPGPPRKREMIRAVKK